MVMGMAMPMAGAMVVVVAGDTGIVAVVAMMMAEDKGSSADGDGHSSADADSSCNGYGRGSADGYGREERR